MQQRKKWELANEKNKRAVSKYKVKYQIYQHYHSVYGDPNRGVCGGFVLCYGAGCGAGEHGLHGIYDAAERGWNQDKD